MLNKTLIPAAVAMMLISSASFAQSSVTISGLADVYAGSIKYAGKERLNRMGSGGMTTSWIGFKGVEDLGNGLKAGFEFGSFLRMDNGALGRFNGDTSYSRDANISLTGDFGGLKLGRSSAPNFVPSLLVNPFGASFAFSPLIQHMDMSDAENYQKTIVSDTGWSNQIVYSTPKLFGGLVVNAHYQFSNQPKPNEGKNNAAVSATYSSGPLLLSGFFEQSRLNNPNVSVREVTTKSWMLGGTYDFSVVKGYLSVGGSEDLVTKGSDSRTYQAGVSVPLGAGKILASYAQTKLDPVDASDVTRKTLTVGYDYFLSKRTDIYTNLMHDRLTQESSGTSFAVGIRHSF